MKYVLICLMFCAKYIKVTVNRKERMDKLFRIVREIFCDVTMELN